MNKTKGFTLVELLAVIVILAIIMIIAIPSVLGTVETAKRKTTLEFNQKVLGTIERKYMEDSNFKSLPSGGYTSHYIYDIKKDLDIPSTGSFFGFVDVEKHNGKTDYEVFLANDNYVLYSSTKREEPSVDDLIERSKMDEFCEKVTDGAITSLDQLTIDDLVKLTLDYILCEGDGHIYYYEASTGRELGHTVYKPENWVTGSCKDNTVDGVLNSIK